jgi:hypothetical protein
MSGIDHLLQRLRKQREEGGLRRGRGGGQGDGQAARFLVTKQSWRGSYRRLLCITPTHIVTVSSIAGVAAPAVATAAPAARTCGSQR